MSPLRRTAGQAGRLLSFAAHYAWHFLVANVVVAREIVTPGSQLAPAVLRFELRCRTDVEVASFIALVGLTPGALVVGSDDRRERGEPVVTLVHLLHAHDLDAELAELRDLETRMLAAWRRDPGGLPAPQRAGGPS
ncbi:Na+/H+ antiporter subunit E [Kineococcus terrestris]|uniref:Na+/H+ antiporter subunit E n=1 Tax=Kineococcus terrestris TaxID=2044856 RepID=UPI0034DB1C84